ncbi:GNAT family N-acetyltransferase [Sporosarcina sp. P16b]|uniref:GNAT family N-acetyltransferase n=1 Tax=Sporosarcina sp. P16b TaxID=2048261 RepID=UPI000C1658CA|nr:GNAT family N-acetyltransferase [Sporosarcina sp. P16b]PIC69730.1 GNAT family N-acetyltransferase [Sporosarcina sp. P16b]
MIRKMTVEDIPDVQQIAHTAWQHTFQQHIPTEVIKAYIERTYSDLMLKKQLEKTMVLLAIDELGNSIGYLSYTPIDVDGESELTALHMLPGYWSSGYEEALLKEALVTLQEAVNVDVYVDQNDIALQDFYAKQGFNFVESFPELFEGVSVNILHYSLPITQPAHT